MVRLGDYIEQIRGVSYKPENLYAHHDIQAVSLLRANNIQEEGINFNDVVFVDKSCAKEVQYIKMGDILVCTSSGSKNLVGKAAMARKDLGVIFGAFCKVIRAKEPIDPIYTGHFFKSARYRKEISAISAGANINNLRTEHFNELEIPLPPLAEQQKIADELDKISDLIAKRKQQLDKLDLLVKAKFVEMFGDNSYNLVNAEDVCDFITKGTTPKGSDILESDTGGLIPFLKVYNLSFDGRLLFSEKPQYISTVVHNTSLARSKVYPGDVLMNIVGPPLGKFCLIPDEYTQCNINQAMAIFRAKSKILPQYLLYALMRPITLQPFLDSAVGIRQQNLSLKQCRELKIPLPPLTLQTQFAAYVQSVEKTKRKMEQGLAELEQLYRERMQAYFE